MIEIKKDSLEARILRFLMENYPATVKDLSTELGIKEGSLKPALSELGRAGILGFDQLPDKTFIRLLRTDFTFAGIKAEQRRGLVKKSFRKKEKDYNGIAYR